MWELSFHHHPFNKNKFYRFSLSRVAGHFNKIFYIFFFFHSKPSVYVQLSLWKFQVALSLCKIITFHWHCNCTVFYTVSLVLCYLHSEPGTTKLDTFLSLEATRADSDFPSFKVKEFFLWESCSLDISSEAENLRRSWSASWVREERFLPVAEVSTMSLPSTSSGTESSMICSGSTGRSKISLWLRFGGSGT